MSYQSGFRHEIIIPLNRKSATVGKYGVDSGGIQWEEGTPLHANVDYQRGKSAMNAGALDSYAVKIVRMNWTDKLNERSRVKYQGKVYQIIPETFNGHYRENTLQFLMQLVVQQRNIVPPVPENALYDADGILLQDADGICLTADYK